MLTSEEVREIEAVMDDPAKRWAMSPGAAITYIEALLEDRAELVAEIERLRAVVEAARELMAARGPHIEGSVPLKNALAALEGDSHA
jgi:hypothetical protein